jgi:hypothetical protein
MKMEVHYYLKILIEKASTIFYLYYISVFDIDVVGNYATIFYE